MARSLTRKMPKYLVYSHVYCSLYSDFGAVSASPNHPEQIKRL